MSALGSLMHLAMSPYTQAIRGVAAGISCLAVLGVIKMNEVDMATYGIDSAFVPVMLVAALVVGVIVALILTMLYHERAVDNKIAEGKIKNASELPYDTRYQLMSVLALIFGVATGMGLAPFAVDYLTVNAGLWTYTISAGVVTAVAVWFWTSVLHTGIRVTVIKAAEFAKDAIASLGDAKRIVDESIEKKE